MAWGAKALLYNRPAVERLTLGNPKLEKSRTGDSNKINQRGPFTEVVTKAVQSSNKNVHALCLWVNCLHDAMELTCFSWILDIFCTGLPTSGRTYFKPCLAVQLAELKYHNLLFIILPIFESGHKKLGSSLLDIFKAGFT